MGLKWPVAASYLITQEFGHFDVIGDQEALSIEPTMYLQHDAKGALRARTVKFGDSKQYEDVHPGVDIACPVGTPLYAVGEGRIVYAGVDNVTGELFVMLRIHNTDLQTIAFYTHMSRIRFPVGTKVYKGQQIGRSGNSGWSYGPHLHFEIRVGPVGADPALSTPGPYWYRWNPERLRIGGDLEDVSFIR